MFEKPQIRVIQNQEVESTREITGPEAEEILRKYRQDQNFSTRQEPQQMPPIKPELTFEEMINQQKAKERDDTNKREQQMNGPKPITFNGTQYDSTVKYGSDDELGFGFRIEIVTDMKLPKY